MDTIPYNTLPHPLPPGFLDTCSKVLGEFGLPTMVSLGPDGLRCANASMVYSVLASYPGSEHEVAWHKDQSLATLESNLHGALDLKALATAGSGKVEPEHIAGHLATTISTYREHKAALEAATHVDHVKAVDVHAGWPKLA